jgi:hypothetical protein
MTICVHDLCRSGARGQVAGVLKRLVKPIAADTFVDVLKSYLP